MTANTNQIPVTIVGGGPVGLYLAICLLRNNIDCRVIEKRIKPVPDSRSLGIHPVSLDLFDKTGISSSFLRKGLKIREGIAFNKDKELGRISFKNCPPPHNYILACPQYYTEQILREELLKLNPDALITGVEFHRFREEAQQVITEYLDPDQKVKKIRSSYLIGCDGKNSAVRQAASIHYSGKRYPDTYIMGDFKDNTSLNHRAAVFLPSEGLIECFPLPDGMRRWVVKTDAYIQNPTAEQLVELVRQRIHIHPDDQQPEMLSSFGVQQFSAELLVKGRVALAGDAAHIISPIGGQGMNLGWLGASKLSACLKLALEHDEPARLYPYQEYQKMISSKAARRAEINMKLGRKQSFPLARDLFLHLVLHTNLSNVAADLFTMRHLEDWWI